MTATYRDGIGIIYIRHYVKVYIYSVRRSGDKNVFVYYYYHNAVATGLSSRGLPPITASRITVSVRMAEIVADPEGVFETYIDNNTYYG